MATPSFRVLPLAEQLAAPIEHGTFLVSRWKYEDAITRFHMPGRFLDDVLL
ncbi:hypothetical protein [Hymenobacter jeollabukensis]|uniref:hypothetical protein n=1 Tax=Hymenobacter jeollabukensis TaxID=2025313 RepID=UPI001484D558|nr:hypothetical protein [Hymenobacter jeollabukensis]